jgi:hypothetical protein
MEEKTRQELYDKLLKENESYKDNLFNLPIKEVIDKSYETAIKDELIYLFYPGSEKFNLDEIKALKRENNSLETLYQGWMDCDLNINELLEDNVRDVLNDLSDDYKALQKENRKKDKER